MASEAGNLRVAQALGADLPGKDRIPDREFGEVSRDPLRSLEKGAFAWSTGGGRELALFALERAARSDAGAARAPWVKVRDRLPDADRRYGNARLAFHAARQLNPAANDWFREAGDVPLSAEAQALARARRAARARVGRRARRRRRDAGCAAAGIRVALLARARAARAGPQGRGGGDPRDARDRNPLLRHAGRRGAGQALRDAGERAGRRRPGGGRGLRRAGRGQAGGEARGAGHAAGIAARVDLHRPGPSRRRAAAGRRLRAQRRALRPRDQHGRPHAVAARLRVAVPRAVPHRSSRPPRARTTSTSRCCTASRARSRASRPTSCRPPAPSA